MARPREFDEESVLRKVMMLFWEKGFRGTSMDDIVKVTKLNKGSLYTCFGNKDALFRLSLQKYLTQGAAGLPRKESPLATLRQFYSYIIDETQGPKKHRRGCLVFNSCLEFGGGHDSLSSYVLSIAKQREDFFQKMIEEAKECGEISENTDTKKASERAFVTAFSIREMSKFKPDKNFLSDIADNFFVSIESKKGF